MKLQGFFRRSCTSENSESTFSAGESTSRVKCAEAHLLLKSPCRGSMKWRFVNPWTKFCRNQFKGESFPDFQEVDARIASSLRRSSPVPLSEESVCRKTVTDG